MCLYDHDTRFAPIRIFGGAEMTNLLERHVEGYQQVRGQRGLLDRALIDIGRLVSVSEEARHFTLTV